MFIKSAAKLEPELKYRIQVGPDPATGGNKKDRNRSRWQRIMGLLFVYTIMSLMVVKVASTAALYQQQQQQQQQQLLSHIEQGEGQREAKAAESTESDNTSDSLTQTAERQNIEKMRAKLQQLQHEQQQQYRQQQQQMQLHLQQMQQQMQAHANGVDEEQQQEDGGGEGPVSGSGTAAGVAAGETAYLLERADDIAPIYGTWRTKARRPQPPAGSTTSMQHATSMSAVQPSDGGGNYVDDNHLYERLPRRSVTMTPMLHDQLPRPPRLSTQRPASAMLRRHFSETPGTLMLRDDFRPKPFHFPFDGPLPEQFKKGEAEHSHAAVNNIQDILHNLHINNMLPRKLPALPTTSLVMMPTGLHIAGSYKNLKSSGLANFFRSKRNKKQMQLNIPLPMFPMAMPMGLYGAAPHQRIAIEQLYRYKPRSPQDINLLALQQQPGSQSKKKNKKQLQSNYNMLLEHGSEQQFVADPFLQGFPPIIALNATRQPQHKRVPFKLNLDIYPVLPPSRPTSVLRNPFQPDYALPSASALAATAGSIYSHPQQQSDIYQTPFKFPTQPPSKTPISFPDQATRYSQQLTQFQPQKPLQQAQQNYMSDDCTFDEPTNGHSYGNEPVETQSNQIMLHLNVFPKQKPTATVRTSTNPFYNHNFNQNSQASGLKRYSEREPPLPKPPSPIEPRHVAPAQTQSANSTASTAVAHPQNQTQQHSSNHSISRSDNLSVFDFEHPIVAAEVPHLPKPAALTANTANHTRYNIQGDHYRYPNSVHIDQLAAEAQTASLFRFPVEDLIQFQVDDAL